MERCGADGLSHLAANTEQPIPWIFIRLRVIKAASGDVTVKADTVHLISSVVGWGGEAYALKNVHNALNVIRCGRGYDITTS